MLPAFGILSDWHEDLFWMHTTFHLDTLRRQYISSDESRALSWVKRYRCCVFLIGVTMISRMVRFKSSSSLRGSNRSIPLKYFSYATFILKILRSISSSLLLSPWSFLSRFAIVYPPPVDWTFCNETCNVNVISYTISCRSLL